MSTEWVRVTDRRTGHQYTVTAARAERDSQLRPLKAHPVDANGAVLAAKHRHTHTTPTAAPDPDAAPLDAPDTSRGDTTTTTSEEA